MEETKGVAILIIIATNLRLMTSFTDDIALAHTYRT